MTMFDVIAMAPPTPAGTEPHPTGSLLQMILMFGTLGVMFYFLLIRPQSKQRKEHENLLKNMKSGDRILTSGGIFGMVTNVKEKTVMVKIADNVKVEIVKSAVTAVIPKAAGEETESTK
jgi:preprotein translocase subunit YajC